MIRAIVATRDPLLAAELAAFAHVSAQLEIGATTDTSAEVMELCRSGEFDVLLLDEELVPVSIIDFTRAVSSSFPEVGVILLARGVRDGKETTEFLLAAPEAGARAVLPTPLAFETFENTTRNVAELSRSVRRFAGAESDRKGQGGIGGAVIAVAGAKGGSGASTVAVHLALALARQRERGAVCLIDMDLQAADLRLLLNLRHARNILDLVGLGEDHSGRAVDETVYMHRSGLRVLLGPEYADEAENFAAGSALQVLGALKFRHDVVIADVGAALTEASGATIKFADRVLLVTTPDVLALKAANRTRALWDRLEIRDLGVTAVINRVSKESEIQPATVRQRLEMPTAETVLPASFRALEDPLNTGVPERLQGPLADAFDKLGHELLEMPEPERKPRRRAAAGALLTGESGQAATETMALVLIIAICLLGVWQMVLVGYTYVMSGHAAREGSRSLAVGENEAAIRRAAAADVRGAWRDEMRVVVRVNQAEVAVRLKVPALIPGGPGTFSIESTEGTVIENRPLDEDDT